HPVRTGYIGQEQPLTAAELPKSAAELYPKIGVSEVAVPSPAGRIRCQVFSPPVSNPRAGARPMMLYLHRRGLPPGHSEGPRLHPEQVRGGKRDGGREGQLSSRARVAVSGLPR